MTSTRTMSSPAAPCSSPASRTCTRATSRQSSRRRSRARIHARTPTRRGHGRLRPQHRAGRRPAGHRRREVRRDPPLLPRGRLRRREAGPQLLHRLRGADARATRIVLTLACGKFRFFDKQLGTSAASRACSTSASATTPTPRSRSRSPSPTRSSATSTTCRCR